MKRALTMILVLALALGLCPLALAQEETAIPKMTPLAERITAYIGYLEEVFDAGGVITYVGLADVNKDKYPELFYVLKEGGESFVHFAYYDEGEVAEYNVDFDAIGVTPKSFSLVRRRRVNSSEHCWVLQVQSKDEEKWNQRLFYTFTRSDTSLVGELKFLRRWKSSRNMYYVDEVQTLKSIYDGEVKDFNERWPEANMDVNIKSRGVIRKVTSTKKWNNILKNLTTAYSSWNKM